MPNKSRRVAELVNVLQGRMSLVGPRPEMPFIENDIRRVTGRDCK